MIATVAAVGTTSGNYSGWNFVRILLMLRLGQACEVLIGGFQGVEGNLPSLARHRVLREGVAHGLCKQAKVIKATDIQQGHAVPQEHILTVEGELMLELGFAVCDACAVGL